MTDYVATLMALVESADITYTGPAPDYADIVWRDSRKMPSREECDAAWPQIEIDLMRAAAENGRAAAYRAEADPLFFEWQRGEGTEQAWRDKVEEIRQRYPYPV